jgi:hypothetical protein
MVYTTFQWTETETWQANLSALIHHLRDAVVPLVLRKLPGQTPPEILLGQVVYAMQSLEHMKTGAVAPSVLPVVAWGQCTQDLMVFTSKHTLPEHTPEKVPLVVNLLLKTLQHIVPKEATSDELHQSSVIKSLLDVTQGLMDPTALGQFLSVDEVEALHDLMDEHPASIPLSDEMERFHLMCLHVQEKLYGYNLSGLHEPISIEGRLRNVLTRWRNDREFQRSECPMRP